MARSAPLYPLELALDLELVLELAFVPELAVDLALMLPLELDLELDRAHSHIVSRVLLGGDPPAPARGWLVARASSSCLSASPGRGDHATAGAPSGGRAGPRTRWQGRVVGVTAGFRFLLFHPLPSPFPSFFHPFFLFSECYIKDASTNRLAETSGD